jgi:hypothetical protein
MGFPTVSKKFLFVGAIVIAVIWWMNRPKIVASSGGLKLEMPDGTITGYGPTTT